MFVGKITHLIAFRGQMTFYSTPFNASWRVNVHTRAHTKEEEERETTLAGPDP